MGLLVFSLVILSITGHSSASWCVCKDGLSSKALQETLDYACGAGANCQPTHVKGPCFNPNTVMAHCSYAVNSYFQKKGQSQGSCNFSGAAVVTGSDPSYSGCSFPASASAAGTTNPKANAPITTLPNGKSPYSGTPGVLGGVTNGTEGGINPDYTDPGTGFRLHKSNFIYVSTIVLLCSVFMF